MNRVLLYRYPVYLIADSWLIYLIVSTFEWSRGADVIDWAETYTLPNQQALFRFLTKKRLKINNLSSHTTWLGDDSRLARSGRQWRAPCVSHLRVFQTDDTREYCLQQNVDIKHFYAGHGSFGRHFCLHPAPRFIFYLNSILPRLCYCTLFEKGIYGKVHITASPRQLSKR